MNLVEMKFIGIGAPKCGTTWVTHCLNEHPEVEVAKHKDTNFFLSDEFIEANYDLSRIYKCLTPEDLDREFCSSKKVKGEFSVNYILDQSAAPKIKQSYPDTKIIVCIRNPVDALYSAFNYFNNIWFYKDMNRFKAESFRESIANNEVKKEFFNYFANLKLYFDLFNSENVFVIVYDDIKNKPEIVMRDLYSFLGVDSTFIPASLKRKVNVTGLPKNVMLEKFGIKVAAIMKSVGLENLLFKLYAPYAKLNEVELVKEPIDVDLKTDLMSYYSEDIDLTGKLIGRDLSDWKNA
jgi:hypothetical protein